MSHIFRAFDLTCWIPTMCLRVANTVRHDTGSSMASDLQNVHRFFEVADEAFRRFRTIVLEENLSAAVRPTEWIPICDN